MTFEGGVMAVEVDSCARLVPRAAWVARQSTASMGAVLEELLRQPDTVVHHPTRISDQNEGTAREGLLWIGLPAEVIALYDNVASGMSFFGAERTWRVRGLLEQRGVVVPVKAGRDDTENATQILDLPDGTVIAFVLESTGPTYVRLREDQLRPNEGGLDGFRCRGEDFVTSQFATDVPIVGHSLAANLQRALETGGATDLPETGRLWDVLPEWRKFPPPPHPRRKPRK